jgi:hypothetical protein
VGVRLVIAMDIEIASDDKIRNSGSEIEQRCEFVNEHWKWLGVAG